MPTAYNDFCKRELLALRGSNMSQTNRMRHVAQLWREHKGMTNYEEHKKPVPKPRKAKKGKAGALDDGDGGSLLGSFLSGISTPFRIGAAINPSLGFGIAQAADALGVPKIQDVISGGKLKKTRKSRAKHQAHGAGLLDLLDLI